MSSLGRLLCVRGREPTARALFSTDGSRDTPRMDMENLAPAPPQACVRLTDDQVQDLVVRTVATHAESLLRTAYRHSLCADDAHDAYQRGMEILLRRAHRIDPASVHNWLHVVVKHEALEVRRSRAAAVATEDIDFDRHESPDVTSPEDRAVAIDRTTRAAEALRRLKPQELRAMWLRAMGHSYAEISELTGFSATKVNRCLAEGRKSFLERFDGIEAGAECERWQPVLSAIIDGEATGAQMNEVRPHLRNCQACRATLRGLHDAHRPLAAVLPVGLIGASVKLSGLLERVMPGFSAGGAEGAGAAVSSAGVLGVGGAKLAAVLASGAVAIGGGTAVVQHAEHSRAAKPAVRQQAKATSATPVAVTRKVVARRQLQSSTTTAAGAVALRKRSPTATHHAKRTAPPTSTSASELKPLGHEVTVPATTAVSTPSSTSAHATAPSTT